MSKLPESLGGLPEGAPQVPAEAVPFPNVYEKRPTREAKPLDDVEQKKLESELATLRDGQNQRANPPPPPPPVQAVKKPAPKDTASKKPSKKEAKKPAADAAVAKKDASPPLRLSN